MKRFSFARMCGILLVVFLLSVMPGLSSQAAANPGRVENFRLICNGNRSAFLAWDTAKNASYYLLYRYDASTGKYTRIAKTSAKNYEVKNLKVGKIYQFAVQSVLSRKGKTAKSEYSDLLEVEGKKLDLGNIHGRYWSVTTTRDIKGKDTKTGKTVKIKKGTAAYANSRANSSTTLITKDGKKVRTSRSSLRYGNLTVSKSYKLYTKAQAEAFVNAKGYSSDTKWLIWISQYTSSVHIFKGSKGEWKRVRIAKCVIGNLGHTVVGVFRLIRRTTAYGKPKIFFSWNPAKGWGLSFHRRIDQNVRGPHSNGCIRLGDSDIDYVAEKCPLGTTVVSY